MFFPSVLYYFLPQLQNVFALSGTRCFYPISYIVFFLVFLPHQFYGVFTPIAPLCFPLSSVLFHPSTTKCFRPIRYKMFLSRQLHSIFSCVSTASVLQCFYSNSSIVFFPSVLYCFIPQPQNVFALSGTRCFYRISYIVFFLVFLPHQFYCVFTPSAP